MLKNNTLQENKRLLNEQVVPTDKKAIVGAPPFYVSRFKFLIVLLVLMIIVPGYYLLIKPQYNFYKSNLAQINRLDKELKINLKQLASNSKIITDYESINKLDKEKIEQILPATPRAADLYINLQSIAQQNNLTVESLFVNPAKQTLTKKIIPGKKTKKDSLLSGLSLVNKINIDFDLQDVSYAKMKKFFHDMEINLRLLDIQSFSFDPENSALSLKLTAYYLKNNTHK
jgi:hypothetical protein